MMYNDNLWNANDGRERREEKREWFLVGGITSTRYSILARRDNPYTHSRFSFKFE
jgi:hypothetical protein